MRCRSVVVALLALCVSAGSMEALGAAPSTGEARRAAKKPKGYERTIAVAIDDIQGYWTETFPDVYGVRYRPVPDERIFAWHPGVQLPTCQGFRMGADEVRGNAFYCFRDNYIAYDDAGLFPHLHREFGAFSVAMVLAHEWGHAVQDRVGNADQPTIYQELQSDCFAGAWTSHIAEGGTKVAFQGGDLERALAALIEFRDAPGSSPERSGAHGSAFDRVSAFQEGFEQGPERCAAYFDEPPVVVQIPFTSREEAAQGGNVPAEDVIPLTVDLLNDFYSQVEPDYEPLTLDDIYAFDSSDRSSIPRCGRTRPATALVKNRVYYCIDDGYIAFDEPFLQDIYDNIGDFGVAALIANPWATYVQTIQDIPGVEDNADEAVLQADCYTGGWTAAFWNGFLSAGSLSAGDLDEFVQAFLVYSRARGISADVPITFLRVRFFRRGFFSGYQSCDYASIAREVASL